MKIFKGTTSKPNRFSKRSLSPMAADQMLQNVFTVCGTDSNTVPLAVIEDFANYKKERFILIRSILAVAIVLLLLAPLLFVKGDYIIAEKYIDQNPVYEVKVTGLFPVQITAMQNGLHLPVYSTGFRSFSIEPTKNGPMDICITFYNHQEIIDTVQVVHADNVAPSFISSLVSDHKVFLYAKDAETGIDYDSIYAKDAQGTIFQPLLYNSEEGYVVFESPASAINVYIPDMVGNELILILTPSN